MVKSLIQDYWKYLLEVESLKEMLARANEKAIYPGAAIDGMPKGNSREDRLADHVVQTDKTRAKLEHARQRAEQQLCRIVDAIENLENPMYRTIMREYYINDKSWEEVAEIVDYSIYSVWAWHREALQEMKSL